MLCQMPDPSLTGFVQHHWMRLKKNVMPEIAWSQLRRQFTPGFEAILQQGVAVVGTILIIHFSCKYQTSCISDSQISVAKLMFYQYGVSVVIHSLAPGGT
jgi:hypothetical protein